LTLNDQKRATAAAAEKAASGTLPSAPHSTETLAEYFDRTKDKTQRSLRRLGHGARKQP
jgi:hypothetical protein